MIIPHPFAGTRCPRSYNAIVAILALPVPQIPVPAGGGVATLLLLPHNIAFNPDGRLYVADRANKRILIFSDDGDFLCMWTGMGGPNDITRGKDGNFYIAEQEDDGKPAQVCVRDANGAVLARVESRHVHGAGVDSVDSRATSTPA
jgi:hypothetical protein